MKSYEHLSIEEIQFGIECEGLDYYFRGYVSTKKLPPDIREAAQRYREAADNLLRLCGLDPTVW